MNKIVILNKERTYGSRRWGKHTCPEDVLSDKQKCESVSNVEEIDDFLFSGLAGHGLGWQMFQIQECPEELR